MSAKLDNVFKLKQACWSAESVDPDLIPFPDATVLIYEIPPHVRGDAPYGYGDGASVLIQLPKNATWRQIAIAADKAVYFSGCWDHRFIESFEDHGEYVVLHTGS